MNIPPMSQVIVPATRSARQARITAILDHSQIMSQSQLRDVLKAEGIDVTQATLSRDLVELGAVKVKNEDGKQIYTVPPSPAQGSGSSARAILERWASEVLIRIGQVNNQLVLRTPPGAAQMLASSVDKANFSGVLGSIAGDDTVLVITDSEENATRLRDMLAAMADQ